jgi:hypothetical protein
MIANSIENIPTLFRQHPALSALDGEDAVPSLHAVRPHARKSTFLPTSLPLAWPLVRRLDLLLHSLPIYLFLLLPSTGLQIYECVTDVQI